MDIPPAEIRVPVPYALFFERCVVTVDLAIEQYLACKEFTPQYQDVGKRRLEEYGCRGEGDRRVRHAEVGHCDRPDDRDKPVHDISVMQRSLVQEKERDNDDADNPRQDVNEKRRVVGIRMNAQMKQKAAQAHGDKRGYAEEPDIVSHGHAVPLSR